MVPVSCRCSAVSSQSSATRGREWLTPRERRRRHGAITPAGCTETGEGKQTILLELKKKNHLKYTYTPPAATHVFAAHNQLSCTIHTFWSQINLLWGVRTQKPVPEHLVCQLHRGRNDLGEDKRKFEFAAGQNRDLTVIPVRNEMWN